jgi:hypothetical protein
MPSTPVEAHSESYALLRRHPGGATNSFSLTSRLAKLFNLTTEEILLDEQ